MQLQEQDRNECLPTSLAMLVDKPKEEVLALWREYDFEHRDFHTIRRVSCDDFWRTSWEVIHALLGAAAVEAYKKTVGWTPDEHGGKGGLWATGGKGRSAPFPKTGRGMLQLIHGLCRHTVAYEDGLIYDPFDHYPPLPPMTWAEYKEKCPGWKIEGVIPTERRSE